jgi:hypothetical protein
MNARTEKQRQATARTKATAKTKTPLRKKQRQKP